MSGLPKWVKWLIFAVYIGLIFYIYSSWGYGRDLTYLLRLEILWIPIILFGLGYLIGKIGNLFVRNSKKKEIVEEKSEVIPNSN